MPILALLALAVLSLNPCAYAEESADFDDSPAVPVPPPDEEAESAEERMAKAAAADRSYDATMAQRQAAVDQAAEASSTTQAQQFGLGLLLTLGALAGLGWWYIRTHIPPRRTTNLSTSTTTLRKSRS